MLPRFSLWLLQHIHPHTEPGCETRGWSREPYLSPPALAISMQRTAKQLGPVNKMTKVGEVLRLAAMPACSHNQCLEPAEVLVPRVPAGSQMLARLTAGCLPCLPIWAGPYTAAQLCMDHKDL